MRLLANLKRDRIALHTDGILEATNAAQEQFGADRFMRFMENNRSLRVEQFADAFLEEISRWLEQSPDQGQQDDITLVVIVRGGRNRTTETPNVFSNNAR